MTAKPGLIQAVVHDGEKIRPGTIWLPVNEIAYIKQYDLDSRQTFIQTKTYAGIIVNHHIDTVIQAHSMALTQANKQTFI